jgi:hypothetical protein
MRADYEPTRSYRKIKMHGFEILVGREARANPQPTGSALDLLNKQLKEMTRFVPSKALNTLRKVRVWIEFNNPDFPCACYHPGREWLVEHGYNPEKTRSVEIANVVNYVDWITRTQPLMTFHEFAHAYHDIAFSYEDPYIHACYRHALIANLYESVPYILGGKLRGYATTNDREYFAELSEAYFGHNDYFPFTREELRNHDPKGYEMIARKWEQGY